MPYPLRKPGVGKYDRQPAPPVPESDGKGSRCSIVRQPRCNRAVPRLVPGVMPGPPTRHPARALGGVRVAAEAGLPADLLGLGVAGQYAIVAVAALRFVAALGLLARVRAAWILAMLVTGGGLALTITGYALGRPDDVRLLLDVASAFYLNQPGVRAVYGIRTGQPR
jgi:hypothetical protein